MNKGGMAIGALVIGTIFLFISISRLSPVDDLAPLGPVIEVAKDEGLVSDPIIIKVDPEALAPTLEEVGEGWRVAREKSLPGEYQRYFRKGGEGLSYDHHLDIRVQVRNDSRPSYSDRYNAIPQTEGFGDSDYVTDYQIRFRENNVVVYVGYSLGYGTLDERPERLDIKPIARLIEQNIAEAARNQEKEQS